MNVTLFGIGYVGLVQAAVLADVGHHVLCTDVDAAKVGISGSTERIHAFTWGHVLLHRGLL